MQTGIIGLGTKICVEDFTLIEPNMNREASKYLIDNYKNALMQIKREGIRDDKAQDLLHDVYLSIYEAESNGEGFDSSFGDGAMSVAQFVHGRIKLYAKNDKYRSDVVDTATDTVTVTEIIEEPVLDKFGHVQKDRKGNVKTEKRKVVSKVKTSVSVHAASYSEGADNIEEDYDSFQKAYAKACVADSTDDIAEVLSIRDSIETCIDICELHDIKIINIFRNIEVLANMLGEFSRKKRSADSIFDQLTELVTQHDEFAEAFTSVLMFSKNHRSLFNEVIATY